jgi:hypothetical protein
MECFTDSCVGELLTSQFRITRQYQMRAGMETSELHILIPQNEWYLKTALLTCLPKHLVRFYGPTPLGPRDFRLCPRKIFVKFQSASDTHCRWPPVTW